MRSLTIAAIALIATAGLAAGQAGRPDQAQRADRARTELTAQLQSLEARHLELLQRLAEMPNDQGISRQLAEIEAVTQQLEAQMQGQHRLLEDELARVSELHADRMPDIADHASALAAREADLQRGSAQLQRALELEHQQVGRTLQHIQETQARTESLHAAETELQLALEVNRSLDRLYGDGPRASWSQQDPADSVWRAAREQMNRGQFEAAARLYQRIHTEPRYRQSTYRADALYWHAFALSRSGSDDEAREALDLLAQLVREYPAGQRSADTNSLMTTVQTRLARRGNEAAVQQIRDAAASDNARIAYDRAVQEMALRSDVQSLRATELAIVAATGEARARAVTLGPLSAGRLEGITLTSAGIPLAYSRSLSSQCARDESEIQLIALNSLVRMDSAAALPVLREVMARRDECAALLRHSALTVVGRLQSASALAILVEAARNDPDDNVRRTALVYLGERDSDQAVGIAGEILASADEDNERTWALQALARMRSPAAWNVIRDYAARADQSSATRRAAIAALSQSGDATHIAFVRDLYNRVGNDSDLKETILMSAAFRRGGADSSWLMAIAQDSNEDAHRRELAVSALSRNSEVGTERFVSLYDGASEKQVKLMVLRVLADRSKSESIAADKLIAIARSETDMDLRKAAVLGLPSNDPRARDLLIEILRKR